MKRRSFIKFGAAVGSTALVTASLPSFSALAAAHKASNIALTPLEKIPNDLTCHWLGGPFWGNRLQDWQINQGWLECIRGEKTFEVRTASLLTRQLNSEHASGHLQMTVQNRTPSESGFCGFLLGVGAGKLEYRGAALAQRAAGSYGGILAVINEQGELSFRDFSNQLKPLGFEIVARSNAKLAKPLNTSEVLLDCQIDALENGKYQLRLSAIDKTDNQEIAFAVLDNVDGSVLQGGVSLVSSPNKDQSGATWRFKDVATGGKKIVSTPQQQLEEVMGCMHSLNVNQAKPVLKLTAQFMPIDSERYKTASLEIKPAGAKYWRVAAQANIEDGYVALFRVTDWPAEKAVQYRVLCRDYSSKTLYQGTIQADPKTGKDLNIALYSCIIPTSKSLDELELKSFIPQEQTLNRYGNDNILFPHNKLVNHCDSHEPDLYVFCGDQYYETFPTRYGRDTKDAKIDTLYRWYLWYWTFRESVRNKPAIMLADDHDVLQGNLWGAAGEYSELPKEEDGGFKWNKELVRMVYRCQHGHNPDPFDATPIKYNIPVAYGEFVYGGVSFAIVEDRKFKTPPDYTGNPTQKTGELLGKRQETFLAHWKDSNKALPKICLTASIWGSPQTDHNGKPLIDYDANGYPADGRTRAVKLVSEANALVLAGDQHLGMVTQQGIKNFDDGATFFAGPAAAAFWQRWFEGNNSLDNQYNNDPNTGNFTDSFGNKMRVLAVANPKIDHGDFQKGNRSWGKFLSDNRLKSEGYGLVRVNHSTKQYQLECWPWQANPKTDKQFEGWPIKVSFKSKLI